MTNPMLERIEREDVPRPAGLKSGLVGITIMLALFVGINAVTYFFDPLPRGVDQPVLGGTLLALIVFIAWRARRKDLTFTTYLEELFTATGKHGL